jgi:hypothetical protein
MFIGVLYLKLIVIWHISQVAPNNQGFLFQFDHIKKVVNFSKNEQN